MSRARLFIVLAVSLLALPAAAQPAQNPRGGHGAPAQTPRGGNGAPAASGGQSVAAIQRRIEQGLPPQALTQEVTALGRIGGRSAASVLISLARHRRASVRVQVAEILGRLGDSRARPVLARLLDDPEPRVRSAAALALGSIGAQTAMPTVIQAAIRGVPEAALVVGEQAGSADAMRLLRSVNVQTLPTLAPALKALLQRPNLQPRIKQNIVNALGNIRSAESEHLLRDVSASLPDGDRLRGSIDQALTRLTAEQEAQQ